MKKKESGKKAGISEKSEETAEISSAEKTAGIFSDDKVIVFENPDRIYESGFYGKKIDERLELSLVEALFLLKKGRLAVKRGKKTMSFKELYDEAGGLDKRLSERYRVYEDLRERGLLVRSGFKFGCDFRVYERGVKLIKGPKSQKEHTKWIVFCIPEDYSCSFQELSRAVRLAHNIRARMLWAIVDNEGDVTYYQCVRETP